MRKIFLILIACCLSYLPVHANDTDLKERHFKAAELPEGNVVGVLMGFIDPKKENHSIVKLKTSQSTTYLEIPFTLKDTKKQLKVGNQYEFYPIIGKMKNVKISSITIPVLYKSGGVIDDKYKEQARFNFHDIKMNEKLPTKLDSFNKTVTNISPNSTVVMDDDKLEIKNYAIGQVSFDITVRSDYFGKVHLFDLRSTNKNFSQDDLERNIDILCSALETKYSLEKEKKLKNPISRLENEHLYCKWQFGWLQVYAGYKDVENRKEIFAVINDIQRAMQSYNILSDAMKLRRDEYEETEIIKYKEERDRSVKDSMKSL